MTQQYFARLVSGVVDWLVAVDPHLHRIESLDGIYSIPTTIVHASNRICVADPIADAVRLRLSGASAQGFSITTTITMMRPHRRTVHITT